jgi:hypothetical protein
VAKVLVSDKLSEAGLENLHGVQGVELEERRTVEFMRAVNVVEL